MLQKENEAEINNVMSGPSDQATAYDSDFVDSPPKKKRVIYKSVFVGSSSKSKVQKNGKSVASSSKCKIVQKKEKRKSPRIAKLAERKEKAIEVPSCNKEVLTGITSIQLYVFKISLNIFFFLLFQIQQKETESCLQRAWQTAH